MKIYFSGAIRGGQEKAADYKEIINFLETYGSVLTKHLGNVNLNITGEDLGARDIYERDINWLNEADLVIADVSIPSLGVGYELAYAEKLAKKIICLYENESNVSAMIKGNSNFLLISYTDLDDLFIKIAEVFEEIDK